MSQQVVKSVKLMLILKLCTAIAVLGIMLFTPFLLSVLTIGIFLVVLCSVNTAGMKAGFGRVFLLAVGCGVQWLVLSILFSDTEIMKTGLIYAGLIGIFGVPLDALEGVMWLIPDSPVRCRKLQKYRKSGPEIVDAEIVDD